MSSKEEAGEEAVLGVAFFKKGLRSPAVQM